MSKAKRSPSSLQDSWHGVELSDLRALEQHLCRCAARVDLFGGNDETVDGYLGMAGRLIDEVFTFLRRHRISSPSQLSLCQIANPPIRPPVFGMFLKGKSPRRPEWFRQARDWLKYLLLGGSPEPVGERVEVFVRIDQYFFRGASGDNPTPYFDRLRRMHGEPCSRTELAGEIAWFTRQHALTSRHTELIWVSGSSFVNEPYDPVTAETASAIAAGVTVTFVSHSAAAGRAAFADVTTLLTTNTAATNRPFRTLDLADATATVGWWEVCSALVKYVYLYTQTQVGELEQILYIVRDSDEQYFRGQGPVPLALRATDTERSRFLAWWERVRHLARPDAAAPENATGRTDPIPLQSDSLEWLARAKRIFAGGVHASDFLVAPEDVLSSVEIEARRIRAQEGIDLSSDIRTRLKNEWTLQIFHGGQPVACQRTDRGVLVFAVGSDEIRRFLEHFPRPEQRPGVVITTPPTWQPPSPPDSPNR